MPNDKVEPVPEKWAGNLPFADIIDELKNGKKCRRAGWSGMWIVLMPALQLPPHSSQEPGAKVNDRTAKHIGADTPLDCQPYFAMYFSNGHWQPGWNPSIPDLLATDWQFVP